MFVTAEELLAGKEMTFEVEIPPEILSPSLQQSLEKNVPAKRIKLRPLTIRDIQLIARAAKDDQVLTSILMIQKAVIEPKLKQNDIDDLHGGLVRFLVNHINQVSGLSTTEDDLRDITESPLMRTFFLLAREFNWTPQQVREMTIGQILGYLEMANQTRREK